MRIAIDARELGGRPTGVGRYLAQLLTAWAGLPGAAAHEFVLCTPGGVTLPDTGALRLSVVSRAGSGTLWEQAVLPRLVTGSAADILFAPAYTAPLWCRVPVVQAIHDVSFAAHPEWFSRLEGARRRLITRLSARRAARVITLSDFSKREIVRLIGIDPSRIEVIYLGASALHRAGERKPLVLYVGSIFDRRHVPELIEGFCRLTARRPDARLEIVGDNRTTPPMDLEGLIGAHQARAFIRVRSYVSDAELGALYGQASAFVFLSDYEGFGLTPLEAMAAGVPVAVLDTAVAREIYGPAAIYVERPEPALVADALDRLLTAGAARDRLVEAGLAQVERYSWRECAHRTLQVLLASA
jgi:glycosyltransferase involved in cell wall biosynthesis